MQKILPSLIIAVLAATVLSCAGPSRLERGNYFYCAVVSRDQDDPRRYYSSVFRGNPTEWKTYAYDFMRTVEYHYDDSQMDKDTRNCWAFSSAAEARKDRSRLIEIDATGRLRPIETHWSP